MTDKKKNVHDYMQLWEKDAILAEMDKRAMPFSVLLTNLENDFNIATAIRNANAFTAKEVIIYGSKRYDRRGTVGSHHYTRFSYVRQAEDLQDTLRGLPVIGVDNVEGAVPIETFEWPDQPFVMAFGQEASGLPQEVINLCENVVYIKQYGATRSLNVGTASGIAMYDFIRKYEHAQAR